MYHGRKHRDFETVCLRMSHGFGHASRAALPELLVCEVAQDCFDVLVAAKAPQCELPNPSSPRNGCLHALGVGWVASHGWDTSRHIHKPSNLPENEPVGPKQR